MKKILFWCTLFLTCIFVHTGLARIDVSDCKTENNTWAQALATAFQNAGAGGEVYVAAGVTVNLNGTVVDTAHPNQSLVGEGWNSVIETTSSSTALRDRNGGLIVKNIQIYCSAAQNPNGIAIRYATHDATPETIYDGRVSNSHINGFGYGIVALMPQGFIIENNYIYSTGTGAAPDTGGAIQAVGMVKCIIKDNIIVSDAENSFQHGMYLTGALNNVKITNNIIKNFWSCGIHIYGSGDADRIDVIISKNTITNCNSGILVSRSAAGILGSSCFIVSGNQIDVAGRTLLFAGKYLEDYIIENNQLATGPTVAAPSLEIVQSGSETLRNFVIRNNQFLRFGSVGAIRFNNPISINGLIIEGNQFETPQGAGTTAFVASDPTNGGYIRVRVRNNTSSGTPVVSAAYDDKYWRTATWDYGNNAWDPASVASPTVLSSGSPYSVIASDETLWINTGASNYVVNLPSISALYGRNVTIIKTDSGAGAVCITPYGSQKINGVAGPATCDLPHQFDSVVLQSVEGAGWVIIGGN